jgi:hypothetical protein
MQVYLKVALGFKFQLLPRMSEQLQMYGTHTCNYKPHRMETGIMLIIEIPPRTYRLLKIKRY